MKNSIITLTAFILLSTIFSCKKEDDHHASDTKNSDYINTVDCNGISPTYTVDVAPITKTKCAINGCHNAATASHGLILEGYNASKNNFNLHSLLCAINRANGCLPMPKDKPKLSDGEIKTITCWAKNNFPL